MDPRIIILDGEISYEDATGDKRRETLIDEWHERMNGSEVFWEAGEWMYILCMCPIFSRHSPKCLKWAF